MSHHYRGIVDGVVHYCDSGFAQMKGPHGNSRVTLYFPWCMLDRKNDIVPVEKAVSKPIMVTCVQCMYIRKSRP
jgi:hypothetical protein